ncbi:MAG TPA: DUF3048 domain-containing protein, partial [Angustibacter sp.]|nr:DUF3048 domain-containing protein [Angustibacter sp.]
MRPPRRTRNRKRALTGAGAAAVVAVLAISACSGKPAAPQPSTATTSGATSPSSQATPSTAGPAVAPLTGVRVTKVAAQPALVVKIENSSAARPQTGLDRADLVVEEL